MIANISTLYAFVRELSEMRRRGSTVAAISGANDNGAALIVHDAQFAKHAAKMGAWNVKTIDDIANNRLRGTRCPIVVDHHVVVDVCSAFAHAAERAELRADLEATSAKASAVALERERAARAEDKHRFFNILADIAGEIADLRQWESDGGR